MRVRDQRRVRNNGTRRALHWAAHARRPSISLDGDLLVHPADLLALASGRCEHRGLRRSKSGAGADRNSNLGRQQPAGNLIHHGEPAEVTTGMLEWTGLVTMTPSASDIGKGTSIR